MKRLIALALLSLLVLTGCAKVEVDQAERDAILSAAELRELGFTEPAGPVDEAFEGTRWFDGSKDIAYHYESTDPQEPRPRALYVDISIERSATDAAAVYQSSRLGGGIGVMGEHYSRHKITDECSYAERCELLLVSAGDQPIGNQLFFRQGRVVYIVQVYGFYLTEEELWQELLQVKIERLLGTLVLGPGGFDGLSESISDQMLALRQGGFDG